MQQGGNHNVLTKFGEKEVTYTLLPFVTGTFADIPESLILAGYNVGFWGMETFISAETWVNNGK